MSNLKEPLLKHDFFPDDTQKNQDLKRALDDIYYNASWRDVEIETVTPSKESMLDGESKFARVDGVVRRYHRVGNDLYFNELTKTTTPTSTSILKVSVNANITASTTQTQGEGLLTATLNEISTVANNSDTVTLPNAATGTIVIIIHNGAEILKIFPSIDDDINKSGIDVAITILAGDSVVFGAINDTDWDIVAQIL